ncbi:LADA_0H14114g1_1 [Lachancea dasiensis]|uniref:LADA_0H14114g1_1 n=1 Tax=Lachancea dasiensis TaxID=1072105 RepID=A0A1G4K4A0_9SACH|nr:LADA_0H14114g1_1 [Lachancea dasiensis]
MPNSYRRNENGLRETKPKLPTLPPLVTGHRMQTPERSRRERDDERVAIGWSQVNESKFSPRISDSAISSGGQLTASQSGSGKRHTRRPPPPMSVGAVEAGSLKFPVDYTSPSSLGHLKTPMTPQSYKSPFIGEEELEVSGGSSSTPTKVIRSPFVGDTSVLVPRKYGSHDSQWIVGTTGGNFPTRATAGESEYSDVDLMHTLKELPPLPPMSQESRQRLNFGLYTASTEPTSVSLDANATQDRYEQLHKPFRPFTDQSRQSSGNRAISDSISSYYSNSNYAFNDEILQHRSFESVAGNRPLQQVPSVTVPMQPFNIDQLDENKLFQCYSVYMLSDVYEWLLKVYFEWFNECVFRKFELYQMVQLLLEFQLPTSCDQDVIDSNVDKIMESLVLQGAVRFEAAVTQDTSNDEITFIVAGLSVQGVFTNLIPCYSHETKHSSAKQHVTCYSPRCSFKSMKQSRPVLKLSEIINKSVGLWSEYWKLSPEELSEINPREVSRQSFIFDLIILEERSLNLAHAAIEIYGRRFDPSLLPNDPNFKKLAFDLFEPMIDLHKELLLTPIFWKLSSQGKFIDGVGKIYLQWCNAAKDLYIQYAESMATVHEVINWEKEQGTVFAQWLKKIDDSPEIFRSKLYHDVIFFGGFFKALQNIPVTLNSILKSSDPSMEDYEYLKLAIREVEKLNATVDRVHGAAVDQRRVIRFARQLSLSSGSNSSTVGYVNINEGGKQHSSTQEKLDLGLNQKSRKIIKAGTVFKKRDLWLENTQIFLVLLDNYLLITEVVAKNTDIKYRLSERPIPIDYLSLEAKDELSLPRFSSSKTDTQTPSLLSIQNASESTVGSVKAKTSGSSSPTFKGHSPRRPIPTQLSSPVIQIRNEWSDHQESSASFKIRNTATNESFTFSTHSVEERDSWVSTLVACFKSHHANKKEIYALTCLTDKFSYEEGQAPTNLPILHEGSSIALALETYYNVEEKPGYPIQTDVRCTVRLHFEGKDFILCAVGLGVYMTIYGGQHQWKKILALSKVTRMEINIRLNVLFVLADRRLCYFNIPSIMCAYYSAKNYLPDVQVTGILLQEKVGFFTMAEDFGNLRQLFYERKGTIVVLTPEFNRLTKHLKFFKLYKEYKLPSLTNGLLSADVKDIVVFSKSFIVCSAKGAILFGDSFNDEGLFLPSFSKDTSVNAHKHHFPHHSFRTQKDALSKNDSSKQKMAGYVKTDIANSKTACLSCFQLSDNDFIMIYDEAVIRINKNAEIPNWTSDILVLDFHCLSAAFTEEFLILFGENLVQIYDLNYAGTILNTKLSRLTPVQIIKGKKIRHLSSDRSEQNPAVVLSHPTIAGRQLVLEFCRDV